MNLESIQLAQQKRQLLLMLKVVIDRAFEGGIQLVRHWQIDGNGAISGVFQSPKGLFQFVLAEEGLSYYPINQVRSDSFKHVVASNYRFDSLDYVRLRQSCAGSFRLDARRAAKCNGRTTYSCGKICIPNNRTCRLAQREVITPKEFSLLSNLAEQVDQQQVSETKGKKKLEDMTLRELREEAQKRGVPGYSHVTKETLLEMVRAWDAEPESQRKIVRVIEKKEKERKANPFRSFVNFFDVLKKYGLGKRQLTLGGLIGVGVYAWGQVSSRYTGKMPESAKMAKQVARTVNVAAVGNAKNITFAVTRAATKGDNADLVEGLKKGDPEFFGSHHFVKIPTDPQPAPANLPSGITTGFDNYNAVIGTLNQSLIHGRNPQAVQLAAEVLAYSRRYAGEDGKLSKNINLIGDREGGIVVNEAIEILKFADRKLAEQINAVSIGTPDFGLRSKRARAEQIEVSHVTVMGGNDPLRYGPQYNSTLIGTVRGGTLNDYLKDKNAVEAIAGAIGKHDKTQQQPVKPLTIPRVDPNDTMDVRNSPSFGITSNGELDLNQAYDRLSKQVGIKGYKFSSKEEEDRARGRIRREAEKTAKRNQEAWRAEQARKAEEAKAQTASVVERTVKKMAEEGLIQPVEGKTVNPPAGSSSTATKNPKAKTPQAVSENADLPDLPGEPAPPAKKPSSRRKKTTDADDPIYQAAYQLTLSKYSQ